MITREQCVKGGKTSSLFQKERSRKLIEEYNKNPKRCITCNEAIPYHKRCNKFCGHSCAAHLNNMKYPKRFSETTEKCECGGKKQRKSICCQFCNWERILEKNLDKTLKECTREGPTNTKHCHVRAIAHVVLEKNHIPKKCKVCGFDSVLDVCHIKEISSFEDDTLLREINSLINVVYLCPNHHRMLHKKMISVVDIFGSVT